MNNLKPLPCTFSESRTSTYETLAGPTLIRSEPKSRAMEFPVEYREAVLMIYQGDMVIGSNEWRMIWIYFLAGRENRIFIFVMSRSSEKVCRIFDELRTFCE
jgi:hypothetical protein